MKRVLLQLLLAALIVPSATAFEPQAKKPCAPSLDKCPDEGCGTRFDANLNRRKNVRSDNSASKIRTLASIKKLDDPEHFSAGDDRDELEAIGEGDKVTVAAYVIAVKPGGAETCNCGLTSVANTDNHIVLVTKTTVDKFPTTASAATNKARFTSREWESVTAEFTPRVRLDHPNFSRAAVLPLINKTPQKALLARITGLLMFDSEHFIRHKLVRATNWEIHPVLKFEFCTTGTTCKVGDNSGWKSIDDQ